jgi:iron complex transport system ATP-binding protein
MIAFHHLTFRHRGAARAVIEDVTAHVAPGEVAALLGPNGAGKSTLVRCAAGLWRPEGGEILLEDRPLETFSVRERAQRVAVVFQEHETSFPYLVRDMVLLGRVARVGVFGRPRARDHEAAHEALAAVGIAHLADRIYTRLSGGERQMVMLARALAQEARILLLDEPTAQLDLHNQLSVLKTVRRIARARGLTVLMSVHDPNLALAFATRAILLKAGRLLSAGPAAEVITAENVRSLYGVEVDVVSVAGRRVVFPRVRDDD